MPGANPRLRLREAERRHFGRDDEVGDYAELETSAERGALHGRDDWPLDPLDLFEQPEHIELEQLSGAVVQRRQVGAGGERRPLRRDDDATHLLVPAGLEEVGSQRSHDAGRQRVGPPDIVDDQPRDVSLVAPVHGARAMPDPVLNPGQARLRG